MPITELICPDGIPVLVDECLKSCRMGNERCLTLPTLKMVTEEREWSGLASTTQLLNGTMYEYLRLTKPYAIDPQSRAFMLQGTKHHRELELVAHELGLASEIPMNVDRDIFDLLEWEGKELVLTDYKLWGSFKIAQALGIEEIGKQPDPSGAVYKTGGKWGKAGSSKMVPIWGYNPDRADNWEAELQLNRYRVMLKDMGITVSKIRLQVTARDGGLYIAHNRGVMLNIYKIPVKILPDDEVKAYFQIKEGSLKVAMEEGWNSPCTAQESWDGIRCERFCDVWNYCPKGVLVHQIGSKGGD